MKRIERRFWRAMGSKVAIGPGKVLTVVDREVHVMQCMVRRAVEPFLGPMASDHVAVMYEDGPNLHSYKKTHVEVFLYRAEEHKDTGLG